VRLLEVTGETLRFWQRGLHCQKLAFFGLTARGLGVKWFHLLYTPLTMQRVLLSSLREFLLEQFEITPRTLSWYLSEGIIPKPEYDGREGYYNLEKIDIINFIGALRMLNREFNAPLRAASRVLSRHQKNLKRLVDMLGGLATEYPVQPWPFLDFDITGKNARNRLIRERFFERLAQVKTLEELSLLKLVEELEASWSAPQAKANQEAKPPPQAQLTSPGSIEQPVEGDGTR